MTVEMFSLISHEGPKVAEAENMEAGKPFHFSIVQIKGLLKFLVLLLILIACGCILPRACGSIMK